MKHIKKIGRFALFIAVVVPYVAVVGGIDIFRMLWKEA